jgi:hypothetical protein
MAAPRQLTAEELRAGLDHICDSPKDHGILELIARRPRTCERELLEEGRLDLALGLVGDNWKARENSSTSSLERQLTIMNSRVIALVANEPSRWPLAGDQLYIDLDLSAANLPPGTRLALGSAVIEVTAEPHTGCRKFRARFGSQALQFVNSPLGRQLNLRGINARVVQPGIIQVRDVARKIEGQLSDRAFP